MARCGYPSQSAAGEDGAPPAGFRHRFALDGPVPRSPAYPSSEIQLLAKYLAQRQATTPVVTNICARFSSATN
jgi:hypothetical protein